MDLSIVTTLYYSAAYIGEFYSRIKQAAEKLGLSYEVIFVNDGSPDHSLEVAIGLHFAETERVTVVDLSRNFGHHKAIMTGLAHAKGEHVFLIDCDLEESPELLIEFHEKLHAEKVDVVYGVQEERGGGLIRRFFGGLFYTIFNGLSDIKIPRNLATVRLMSRRYVNALLACQEKEMIIAGLWAFVGFEQLPITITKPVKPSSTYNLRRRFEIILRSITAFSAKPLIYITYLGIAIVIGAALYIAYHLAIYLFIGHPPDGYTSLVISIWLLSGLIIFCQGIIAIYLAVLFNEVKQRPYTIIRKLYERSEHEPTELVAEGRAVLHG